MRAFGACCTTTQNPALRQVPAPERLPPAHSAGGEERAGLSSPAAELAEGLADIALFQTPEALQRLQGHAMRAHNIHVSVRKKSAHRPAGATQCVSLMHGCQSTLGSGCGCRRMQPCRAGRARCTLQGQPSLQRRHLAQARERVPQSSSASC